VVAQGTLPVSTAPKLDRLLSCSDLAALASRFNLPNMPKTKRNWLKRLRSVPHSLGDGTKPTRLYSIVDLPANIRTTLEAAVAVARFDRAGPGRPAGFSNFDRDTELRGAIEAYLYEYAHSSAPRLHEWLRTKFDEARVPPMRTLQRWLMTWREDNAEVLQMVHAPKAWNNKNRLALGVTDADLTAINNRWEIDSTIADLILRDETTGEERRWALVMLIDVWSRRIRIKLTRTSNSEAIASLLREAMLDWGVCDELKIDNGKDYISERIVRGMDALGVKLSRCTPFSPWQKPHVERAFGTFLHDLLPLMQGYTGHDIAARKELEERAARIARRTRTGRTTITAGLTVSEFQTFLTGWVDWYNSQRNHTTLGCTPDAKALQSTAPVKRADSRALDNFLSAIAGPAIVSGKYMLRWQSHYYAAPELVFYKGKRVRLRLDATDPSQLFVFDYDSDEFICIALCPELGGTSRDDLVEDVKAEESQRKRAITRQISELKKTHEPQHAAKDIIQARTGVVLDFKAKVTPLPKRDIAHRTAQTDSLRDSDHSIAQQQSAAELERKLGGARRLYKYLTACDGDLEKLPPDDAHDARTLLSLSSMSTMIDFLKSRGEIPHALKLPNPKANRSNLA
jgi:putative transposase